MEKKVTNIIITAQNKPGVFFRILWLFRRKMLNIESVTAGKSRDQGLTRITITVFAGRESVIHACRTLEKMVNVVEVRLPESDDLIVREMALFKISTVGGPDKVELDTLVNKLSGRILYYSGKTAVVEVTGDEEDVDKVQKALKKFSIVDFVRTGRTAVYK